MKKTTISVTSAAAALGLTLFGLMAAPASAQLGAARTIRIIVPFAPAGSSDTLARVLQEPLRQALNQNVIIENRAGAGTNLGTAEVARAEPDGYTLLLTSSAFVVNPALYKSIPYDPMKDFIPIAALPVAPNIIATQAKGGFASLTEAIAKAKADPQKLNYATPGNGTTPQLLMELFKLTAGVQITNIAYNGGGPATQALLSGTVDLPVHGTAGRAGAGALRHHEGHRHHHQTAMVDAARRADLYRIGFSGRFARHRTFSTGAGRHPPGHGRPPGEGRAGSAGAR